MRIAVVGTSGSGKSTFARRAAEALGCRHVELDGLHWQPNWTPTPTDELRAKLAPLLEAPSWVVDGNYNHLREFIWSRATAIVWLRYPFPLTFGRLLRRTFHRVRSGERVHNGNRETAGQALLSRDSVLLWAITSHPRNRRTYSEALRSQPELDAYVFTRPAQAERFLRDLAAGKAPAPRRFVAPGTGR